jgi:nitrate reductase gamma subunit
MTAFLYVVIYAAILAFAVACVSRTITYARTPVHLRWELYPVPHEAPERVKHGGSYFESADSWAKPRRASLLGDLKFMIPEILLLRGLWDFNRRVWYRSFPFHFGLYLLAAATVLLALGTTLSLFAPALMAGQVGDGIRLLYRIAGMAGMALAILGALALLVHRLTDPDLRIYTTAGDIFNLVFFVVALALLAAGYLSRGHSAPDMLTLSKALLTFDTNIRLPKLLTAGLLLSALLLAYVPMTHMSHFIAKFFTYHSVRWDDAPSRKGGKLEVKIAEYLTYRPTWSAAHIGADGRKTWAQIAGGNPAREVKE